MILVIFPIAAATEMRNRKPLDINTSNGFVDGAIREYAKKRPNPKSSAYPSITPMSITIAPMYSLPKAYLSASPNVGETLGIWYGEPGGGGAVS